MQTVIFDLDGTLACGKHRLHLLPTADNRSRTECWDEFNLAAGDDKPLQDNIDLCNVMYESGKYRVVILTGRCDVASDITYDWLQNNNVRFDEMIMRKEGDHRQDIVFKEDELCKIGLNNILCAFDDLPHVVTHIRSLGVTCHHVCDVYPDYAERNRGAGTK